MSALAERARAPRGEVGSVRPDLVGLPGGRGLPGWGSLMPDEPETVPALQWPRSIETYTAMSADPQVWSLQQAVALPVQRYRRELDPQTLDPAYAELLADDLDLPLAGVERVSDGRPPSRFNERRHFARTLSALNLGHAVFEHVGEIDDRGMWRLTDLAPRPARTITDWVVDRQGRLVRVEQGYGIRPVRLDAERLAVFTWQGEPGDPRGRSMLRPLYRPHVARDRLGRIDMVKHERNGMGIPVGFADEGMSPAEQQRGLELLSRMAAGEDVAAMFPPQMRAMLLGVSGTLPDTVASIRLHSEEMARAMLAQVTMLGSTASGSRALGETQLDLLTMAHDAVVQWYCDTLTEQVVARWVERNVGVGAPVPRVVWHRDEHDEPAEADETADQGDVGGRRSVAASGRRARGSGSPLRVRRPVAAAAPVVAGRRLRRALTEQEIAAAIDVETMETEWVDARDQLAALLVDARVQLGSAAVAAIEAMSAVEAATLGDDLAALLAGETVDTTAVEALLASTAARGAAQVVGEAARQGVVVDAPDVAYGERARAEAAGLVGRLARQVADSAQAAAQVAAGPGASPATVADAVAGHLDSLSTAGPERQAAGATSRATHAGRVTALAEVPYRQIYSSELLDSSTCGPCSLIDGTSYDSLDEALADYPGGGYRACEGGERCRGTLVATLETEQEAVA